MAPRTGMGELADSAAVHFAFCRALPPLLACAARSSTACAWAVPAMEAAAAASSCATSAAAVLKLAAPQPYSQQDGPAMPAASAAPWSAALEILDAGLALRGCRKRRWAGRQRCSSLPPARMCSRLRTDQPSVWDEMQAESSTNQSIAASAEEWIDCGVPLHCLMLPELSALLACRDANIA